MHFVKKIKIKKKYNKKIQKFDLIDYKIIIKLIDLQEMQQENKSTNFINKCVFDSIRSRDDDIVLFQA